MFSSVCATSDMRAQGSQDVVLALKDDASTSMDSRGCEKLSKIWKAVG